MSMMECLHLSKSYRPHFFKSKVCAVKNVSFSVEKGSVFGLIGPNGAGKSTTIRMILGLIRPDSGKVVLDSDLERSQIGYLPENPYLYDYLTLPELLEFCGRTSSLDSSTIANNSKKLIATLGLEAASRRPLRTFSKGMLQRAGICFALLHDPSLIILDEPMSGLDPLGRKMVFDLVMELKTLGKTIFFCSHILNDVERLCDNIGLLNRGKLVATFDKNELFKFEEKKVFVKTALIAKNVEPWFKDHGIEVRQHEGGSLLALDQTSCSMVFTFLEQESIIVHGTRESWMTLEELFMQKISE